MHIAYLCGLFPDPVLNEIYTNSKGPVDNAANAFQRAILDGLTHLDIAISVFALPFIRSYPFGFRSPILKNHSYDLNNQVKIYTVGFINLPGYQLLSRYFQAKQNLLCWAKNADNKKIIIIYNIHSPFLQAAIRVKKKYPEINICLIAPDLPEFMSESKNILYRILKKIDSLLIKKSLKKIDSFVLLSDYMADALNVNNKPWLRVEGIYSQSEVNEITPKEKNKTILYCGTLNKRYGIMNLIDAFNNINASNYRLWICGDGNCRKEILHNANIDNRIVYYGQRTRSEVLTLQKRATILVNPRTSKGEYTKFSFPSKTIEYMASGTPCLIHRLKGIPEEYFKYCYTTDNENAEGLKEMILYVCEKKQSELNKFGKKAALFIKEHKNSVSQAKRIYNMLNTL